MIFRVIFFCVGLLLFIVGIVLERKERSKLAHIEDLLLQANAKAEELEDKVVAAVVEIKKEKEKAIEDIKWVARRLRRKMASGEDEEESSSQTSRVRISPLPTAGRLKELSDEAPATTADKVLRLFSEGLSEEEISRELKIPVGEVRLIINVLGKRRGTL